MKFQQIRGATAIVTYHETRFLIDPFFAAKETLAAIPFSPHPERLWPLVDLPLPPEEITRVDAVILTHLHRDHFDQFAADALPRDIRIFVQDETDAATLRGMGKFTGIEVLQGNGDTVFREITLCKTPCLHGEAATNRPYWEKAKLRPDAMGAVFRHPNEPVLYLAGDTIWFDGVRQTLATFGPEVIVINAAEARFLAGPILMGLPDIDQLLTAAPQATIIASHLDAVPHAMLSRQDLRGFAAARPDGHRLLIPEDGETVKI